MTYNALQWLEKIFTERFGHRLKLIEGDSCFKLLLPGAAGAIKIADCRDVFCQSCESMPCTEWDATAEGWNSTLGRPLPVPAVLSLPSPVIEKENNGFNIRYDILSLAYWMLSRLEEVDSAGLDEHRRFPATSSHAYKYCYLDRPIVDEWFDILGQVIYRQWPGLERKRHTPRTLISCDVDSPYLLYSRSLKLTSRVMVGDILKRKSLLMALRNLSRCLKMKRGDFSSDPYLNNIYWIMQVNEAAGNKVAFYFMLEHLSEQYDGCYDMGEPIIRKLLRDIHCMGHEIGYHASYNSYDDENQTSREVESLRRIMYEEGVVQSGIGGRQHYLRWKTPVTANNLNKAKLIYDTTLGYADYQGFRCGTCFEYPMFDSIQDRELNIRQRPLVLMECSVIDSAYMGKGYTQEALRYMKLLKERCCQVGGDFTLLWHNSHFENIEDREFYLELLS